MKDFELKYIKDLDIRETISRFIDSLYSLTKHYRKTVTDFMTPRELYYAEIILKDYPWIDYRVEGLIKNSERKCIILGEDLKRHEEELAIIEIEKINSKTYHKDILGALIHLGLDRRKIGDIIIAYDKAYVATTKAIGEFICLELTRIGNKKVRAMRYENEDQLIRNEVFKETTFIVSSVRLDTIIHQVYNISRAKAQALIRSSKVKINYEVVNSVSYQINSSDMISVRSYGRFIFDRILKVTKKEKYLILVKKVVSE